MKRWLLWLYLIPSLAVAGSEIRTHQVQDNSLLTSDFKTTNAPVDEGILTYESSDNAIQYQFVNLDDAYNASPAGNKTVVVDDGTVTLNASGSNAGLMITQSGSADHLRAGTFRINSDNDVILGTGERLYTDNGTNDFITGISDNTVRVSVDGSASFEVNAAGVRIGGFDTLAAYDEIEFTPTVTLVGGAGNVVPQYVTNTGRAVRIGRIVFVDILLQGDGGDEGAGTGAINIAIPYSSSANHPNNYFPCGNETNGATDTGLWCDISAGAQTVLTANSGEAARTGANQNNTTRDIRLKFFYEI